jgi:hypothetical protein
MSKEKIIILAVILLLVGAGLIFSMRAERGAWVCQGGQWVKQGNPAKEMPSAACKEEEASDSGDPRAIVLSYMNWRLQTSNDTSLDSLLDRLELSEDLRRSLVEGSLRPGYDPSTCTDEPIQSIEASQPEIDGTRARLWLEQTFITGKRLLPVHLEQQAGVWKIKQIDCEAAIPQAGLGALNKMRDDKGGQTDSQKTVELKFQPMQCQTEPWTAWLETGDLRFIKAPTDEELIKTYFGEEHRIDILSAEKLETDMVTCLACEVCQKDHYFTVIVHERSAQDLESLGWVRL